MLSLSALVSPLLTGTSYPQSTPVQTKTTAERLGYPADAKLLIVHADDLGVAHSVNDASMKSFASGLVNSGSIMTILLVEQKRFAESPFVGFL